MSNTKKKNLKHKCAIRGCCNKEDEVIFFHNLPSAPEARQKWIEVCGIIKDAKNVYICSKHFHEEDYMQNLNLRKQLGFEIIKAKLKPGIIPSKNLPSEIVSIASNNCEASSLQLLSEVAQWHNRTSESNLEAFATSNFESSHSQDHLSENFHNMVSQSNLVSSHEPDSLCSTSKSSRGSYPIPPPATESLPQETNYRSLYENYRNQFLNMCDSLKQIKIKNHRQIHEIKILRKENLILKKKLHKTSKKTVSQDRDEINLLQQRIHEIESRSKNNDELAKVAEKMFSVNQLKILRGKQKSVHWEPSEIAQAFSLRFLSAKAYSYCRKEMQIPLPGISTLQRWAQLIDMRSGLLCDVLHLIKMMGEEMSDYEKICVMMFDEMSVKSTMEYDARHDEIIGPHSKMQQVVIRGLTSKWKEIIYVGFDVNMTPTLLLEIITALKNINFKVVAIVSDMGSSNQGLIKQLQVDYTKPFFNFPTIGWDIVYIPDAPHLLKLIRNWFLDSGFRSKNGKIISKLPLQHLFQNSNAEVSSIFKLNDQHFACINEQRQKVSLAAELLSHTTATALASYKHLLPVHLRETAEETSQFIELVNQWFDLMNTTKPHKRHEIFPAFQTPYGLKIKEQNEILDKFFDTIKSMTCLKKNNLQVFQQAILLSIRSTQVLLNNVKKLGVTYILTKKINQDALECNFAKLRTKGGLDDNPTPLHALHRIRGLILSKGHAPIKKNTNTIDDLEENSLVQGAVKKVINPNTNLAEIDYDGDGLDGCSDVEEELEQLAMEDADEDGKSNPLADQISSDGFRYIGGWLAKKYQKKFPEFQMGDYTKNIRYDHTYQISWLGKLSYGGLIEPSTNFITELTKVETIFEKITKGEIPKGKNLVKSLTRKILTLIDVPFPADIIKSFIKLRLMIRMRCGNLKNKEMAKQRRLERHAKRMKKLKKLNAV